MVPVCIDLESADCKIIMPPKLSGAFRRKLTFNRFELADNSNEASLFLREALTMAESVIFYVDENEDSTHVTEESRLLADELNAVVFVARPCLMDNFA